MARRGRPLGLAITGARRRRGLKGAAYARSVVVVHHSYAPGSFDPPDARLKDCSTQRNLDADGRAQARRLGELFRQEGIVVGRVLASPRCRCLDTARLAFGRAEAWDALQGALRDADLRARRLAPVKQAPPTATAPRSCW